MHQGVSSQNINAANHRRSSAFNPVSRCEAEIPVFSSPAIHLSDRQQGIFESQDPQFPSKPQQNDEHFSEDYYCMQCHENFNIKISPCNHKMSKTTKYKCDIDDCKRQFNIGSGLQRHKLVHSGLKPYECDFDQCDQKFNQKSNLNRHRRIHTQQKPFICQKCCKSFTTTTNLKQHVQIHLQDKERRRKYVCEIKGCNKQYLYMCNLKKHKQEHEDPLSQFLGQKRPDFPCFCLTIGNCSFRIQNKRAKDHSEMLITYREVQSGIRYNSQIFNSVLRLINNEQKIQINSCMRQMQIVLQKLLQNGKNILNICFEIDPKINQIINILIKAMMQIISTLSTKVFTIIVPSYNIFRDVVQNLLNDLQPKQ